MCENHSTNQKPENGKNLAECDQKLSGLLGSPTLGSSTKLELNPISGLYAHVQQPQKCDRQIDGLVHDCSNSIANALELPQSCTKPLKYDWMDEHTAGQGHSYVPSNIGGGGQ